MEKILKIALNSEVAELYWDKPLGVSDSQVYELTLDGKEKITTKNTHYTWDLISPFEKHTVVINYETPEGIFTETSQFVLPEKKNIIDITKAPYYANGDGQTMNTEAIQRALDDCKAGDCVYIPEGTYLTGALNVHSDTEIYISENAMLKGSGKPEDYLPRVLSRFEGTEMMCYRSLLNVGTLVSGLTEDRDNIPCTCSNVIIRGKGTICGGGYELAWNTIESERILLKEYLEVNKELVGTCENEDTIPGRVRGRLICINNCDNVWLSGLTLMDGASWNIHMIYSRNILTDHCTIKSKGIWNGDGWDPDSSENCTIYACDFQTGDDAIAIKSGKNPQGNEVNRPTKNIRIFDCTVSFGHGFAIGSEMSGGIEDVRIWDCDLTHSIYGFNIKGTKKRGGYIRDIHASNCIIPRINFHQVGYNDDGIPAKTPPKFHSCTFENMIITGVLDEADETGYDVCAPIVLEGFDEDEYAIRDIVFKNITLKNQENRRENCGIVISNCKNIKFEIN